MRPKLGPRSRACPGSPNSTSNSLSVSKSLRRSTRPFRRKKRTLSCEGPRKSSRHAPQLCSPQAARLPRARQRTPFQLENNRTPRALEMRISSLARKWSPSTTSAGPMRRGKEASGAVQSANHRYASRFPPAAPRPADSRPTTRPNNTTRPSTKVWPQHSTRRLRWILNRWTFLYKSDSSRLYMQ